jgi:hypothetical protein
MIRRVKNRSSGFCIIGAMTALVVSSIGIVTGFSGCDHSFCPTGVQIGSDVGLGGVTPGCLFSSRSYCCNLKFQ